MHAGNIIAINRVSCKQLTAGERHIGRKAQPPQVEYRCLSLERPMWWCRMGTDVDPCLHSEGIHHFSGHRSLTPLQGRKKDKILCFIQYNAVSGILLIVEGQLGPVEGTS